MKRMLLMTVLSMFMISQAVSVNKTAAYQVILDIADFDIEKDSVGRVTISSDFDGTLVDSVEVGSGNETETNKLSLRMGINVVSLVGDGEILDSKIIVK